MRTKENILYHTFIGLPVEIVKTTSKTLAGLKGVVVDETKNMLVLETERGEKKVQKIACVFRFRLESGEYVDVEGKKICFRPEERAKKLKSKH